MKNPQNVHTSIQFRAFGYTLIEVIVALSVFAVLAMISSGLLSKAFDAQKKLSESTEPLSELNLALEIIQQDAAQVVLREAYDSELKKYPFFQADSNQIEFTRGGYIAIPGAVNPSTIRHVAYVCDKNQLVRLTWRQLDRFKRNQPHQQVLIHDLTHCSFSFFTDSKWSDNWYQQKNEYVPRAFQFHVGLLNRGSANFIFMIPGKVPDESK